jgi:serine phosphatase RsbU (regulator of sigma subunit)
VLEHALAEQFITGQLLRVDLTAGTGVIVNAGHPQPLRVRHGRVEPLDLAADLPFGIMPGTGYRLQPLALLLGDRLVLVTDGVLERNATRVDILDVLAATGGLHPREVVHEITTAGLRAVDGTLDEMPPCCVWTGTAEENGTGNPTPARTTTAPPHRDLLPDRHTRRPARRRIPSFRC